MTICSISCPEATNHAIALRRLPPDPFQPQIEAILTRCHKSRDPAIFLDLIGLGAGSTPSGDDVLVGILAGLSIFGGRSSRSDKVLVNLRVGISNAAPAHPTPLSADASRSV